MPTRDRCTILSKRSQVLLPNILSSIEVGVEAVPTPATEEKRLRATVIPGLMPTLRAGLGRVTRVNLDHGYPSCLGFVREESMELGKAPGMHTAFVAHILVLFAAPHLGGLTDVRQVLKHDGTARSGVLYEAFGEDMVMVSSLPKPLARKGFQVPFSRLGAVLLELAAEAKNATFLFFPPPLAQEVTRARDYGPSETQVNTHHLRRRGNGRGRDGDNDMQEIPACTIAQISTTDLPADVLNRVLGNRKGHLKTPCYRSKAGGHLFPLDPIGTLVIADRRARRVWSLHWLEDRGFFPLLQGFLNALGRGAFVLPGPGEGRFHGLRGLHTSGTDQLCGKGGVLRAQIIVGLLVQFHAVAAPGLKAQTGHRVKARGVLGKRAREHLSLFRRRVQLDHHRSIHAKNISYITIFVKRLTPGLPAGSHFLLPVAAPPGVSENGGYDEMIGDTLDLDLSIGCSGEHG